MVRRALPLAPAAIEGAVSTILEDHASAGEPLEAIVSSLELTQRVIGEVAAKATTSPTRTTYRLGYYALGLRAQRQKVL